LGAAHWSSFFIGGENLFWGKTEREKGKPSSGNKGKGIEEWGNLFFSLF
jgi:hypothetical protein